MNHMVFIVIWPNRFEDKFIVQNWDELINHINERLPRYGIPDLIYRLE